MEICVAIFQAMYVCLIDTATLYLFAFQLVILISTFIPLPLPPRISLRHLPNHGTLCGHTSSPVRLLLMSCASVAFLIDLPAGYPHFDIYPGAEAAEAEAEDKPSTSAAPWNFVWPYFKPCMSTFLHNFIGPHFIF